MNSAEKAVVIRRYSDHDGGRWLRTSHVDIVDLRFEDHIHEPESRIGLSYVYLAGEDGDRFVQHYEARHGVSPAFADMPPAQRSTIRKIAPYTKAFLLFSAAPGRKLQIDGTLFQIKGVSHRGAGRVFLESVA